MLAMVLLANTPQPVVSVAYFLYNGLLTCMLLAAEYNDYARHRKPLRVSWPKGRQRSTYYLSLPYRYSVPLLIASAVLRWLVSQSIFYVRIVQYDHTGQLDPCCPITSTCGSSPRAIICAMLLSLIICTALALGARRFKSNMPLVGNCSAAISAACHPPAGDKEGAFEPVMWGEIPVKQYSGQTTAETHETNGSSREGPERADDHQDSESADKKPGDESNSRQGSDDGYTANGIRTNYAHCSFRSKEVITPSPTKLYA